MTRTVLALCAGLLCALAGFRHAAFLRQEAARLRAWTAALKRLSLLMQEGALPLPQALRQAGAELPGPDKLLSLVAEALTADPLLTLPEAFDRTCPPCTERNALMRLADGISRGSLESRCLACDHAADGIAQLSSEAADLATRDARLWQTLGFTGGACLTLMLI